MQPTSACLYSLHFVMLFLAIVFANLEAAACGRNTDCHVAQRTYRLVLPDLTGHTPPEGAIIFVHGYRDKAENVLRNDGLVAVATKHGAAFVAAQAAGAEWNLPGVPSVDANPGIDERAYFDGLATDLEKRFGIKRRNIVIAGFSSGAMMVWHLACQRGNSFAGFVPMSGTFWKPLPKTCPTSSVNLIHYHGTGDKVVPIHGRQIKDGYQGDVYEAIDLLVHAARFAAPTIADSAELNCTRRSNIEGNILELCLFPGKHELRPRHLERAWLELTVKAE